MSTRTIKHECLDSPNLCHDFHYVRKNDYQIVANMYKEFAYRKECIYCGKTEGEKVFFAYEIPVGQWTD
jgi:hypothetical protein